LITPSAYAPASMSAPAAAAVSSKVTGRSSGSSQIAGIRPVGPKNSPYSRPNPVAATPAPATKSQAWRNRRAHRGQPARSATATATSITPSPTSPNIMPNIST